MTNALHLHLINGIRPTQMSVMHEGFSYTYAITGNGYWRAISSRWFN